MADVEKLMRNGPPPSSLRLAPCDLLKIDSDMACVDFFDALSGCTS
jgi:hypothetical protein